MCKSDALILITLTVTGCHNVTNCQMKGNEQYLEIVF